MINAWSTPALTHKSTQADDSFGHSAHSNGGFLATIQSAWWHSYPIATVIIIITDIFLLHKATEQISVAPHEMPAATPTPTPISKLLPRLVAPISAGRENILQCLGLQVDGEGREQNDFVV